MRVKVGVLGVLCCVVGTYLLLLDARGTTVAKFEGEHEDSDDMLAGFLELHGLGAREPERRKEESVNLSTTTNVTTTGGEGPSQGNARKLTAMDFPMQIITSSYIEAAINELKLKLLEEISGSNFIEIFQATIAGLPLINKPLPKPVKILIVSTWRSGSTFLEELLATHPAIMDFYEPLIMHQLKRVRESPHLEEAEDIIRSLLECRYSEPHYMEALKEITELTVRNIHINDVCRTKRNGMELCTHRSFLRKACKLFPWKLMKLVRLKLGALKPILDDPIHSDAQVIFLVRDPRAVMNSRRATVDWCSKDADDCSSPSVLCQDMASDLESAIEFRKLYPNRIHLLRYEDLASDPVRVTRNLTQAIGLDFTDEMRRFLAEHTTRDVDKPWSTSRESRKRVLYWTHGQRESINDVQEACGEVMFQFGYKVVNHLNNLTIADVLEPLDERLRPLTTI